MRVRMALAATFLAMPLFLGGCWGAVETDEVAYVLSMGFDKGTEKALVLTVTVANPQAVAGQAGGGGGGQQEIAFTGSVEANAPLAAFDLMNTATTRRLSLEHTKAFIFSEELAREGLGKWLAPLNRLDDLRETANVYIVKGKASEFMKQNKPLLEMSPSKQYELIARLPQINSFFIPSQFKEFYEQVKSTAIHPNLPLAAIHEGGFGTARKGEVTGRYEVGPYTAGEVPVKGKNRAQFIGNAVFRGDRMVGEMNGTETRAYLTLRGLFRRGLVNLEDPVAGPEYYIGLSVRQGRNPEYRTAIMEDGTVTVDVDVFLEADIVAIASGLNYEDPGKKRLLEESLARRVEDACNAIVRRSQEEFQSDIFGFGLWMKHHFLTQREWDEFRWFDRYPDARVSVNVHARIRRTGLQLKSAPISGN